MGFVSFCVRKVPKDPSGTRRASKAVTPSASSLQSLKLLPVRWSATPPGPACAVQWPARSGAPPIRAVTSPAPVRCAPGCRGVPALIVTGGDPAAPGRLPAGQRRHTLTLD